MVVTVVYVNN